MKRTFFSFLFLTVLVTPALAKINLNFQKDLPEESLNERTVKELLEKKSKVYLIDFWASWCEPCVESMPFYAAELKKMGLDDWTFIAVNLDSDRAQALDFLKKVSLPAWVLHDSKKKLAAKLNVNSIPMLFFVNAKGEVLKIEKGFNKNSKDTFRKNIAEIKKSLG